MTLLLLTHSRYASVHHWLVAVNEPNPGVDSLANCSVVGFAASSNSSTLDVAVGVLVCEMADFHEWAAVAFVEVVAVEQAAFGLHAFVAAIVVFDRVLVDAIAGEDAVATVPEVAAVGWSFDVGLWEPDWHSYAARTRSDRADVGCTHVAKFDRCAVA